jgi:hypothetical protein
MGILGAVFQEGVSSTTAAARLLDRFDVDEVLVPTIANS